MRSRSRSPFAAQRMRGENYWTLACDQSVYKCQRMS
jgi:hypothetical protein